MLCRNVAKDGLDRALKTSWLVNGNVLKYFIRNQPRIDTKITRLKPSLRSAKHLYSLPISEVQLSIQPNLTCHCKWYAVISHVILYSIVMIARTNPCNTERKSTRIRSNDNVFYQWIFGCFLDLFTQPFSQEIFAENYESSRGSSDKKSRQWSSHIISPFSISPNQLSN